MQGLYGDFQTMPLVDLVRFLAERRSTGNLKLESGVTTKQVHLDAGEVVSAGSNDPRDYLGQFLINQGVLTEEQFARAFETQAQTRLPLGRILVLFGNATEEVVRNALSLKLRETFLGAFEWAEGSFAFLPGARPPEAERLDFRLPLDEILREAEVRETVWRTIRAIFPSGGCTLSVRRTALKLPIQQGSLEERILTLAESGCTIEEMALTLHAPEFFIYQKLLSLQRQDVVRAQPPAALPAARPLPAALEEPETLATDPAALMALARSHLEGGHFEPARSHAARALTARPTPEARALLEDIEARWLQRLQSSLLSEPRRLKLQVSADTVKTLPLTASERYLLSRFETGRDVKGVIQIAPLRELDALAAVARFVERGLLRPA